MRAAFDLRAQQADAGRELLEMAGITPPKDQDEGILFADVANTAEVAPAFLKAIAAHRHLSRDSAPPRV